MEQKSGKAEEKKEEETDALVQKRNRNNTKSKDQILLTVKVYHDTEDDLCWDSIVFPGSLIFGWTPDYGPEK